jgi:Na+-translocating ferredoxin:NAD+ oxidoreductase RNF subunit RnfB
MTINNQQKPCGKAVAASSGGWVTVLRFLCFLITTMYLCVSISPEKFTVHADHAVAVLVILWATQCRSSPNDSDQLPGHK